MIGAVLRLNRDRGGQGLVFSALILFTLVAFLASVVNLGSVLQARVRHQGAADAAAYSASVARAQGLSAIAAMNHVQVWIARSALGLVVAVVDLGVLVALNAAFPGAFAWAVPLFQRAVSTAVEWLPRLRQWADRVAKAEDRLAALVPLMAAGEADRIARANGDARALAIPPAAGLPVAPETSPGRFFARVSGLPGWAIGKLFGGGSASQGYRGVSKGEGNVGEGVKDPATLGKLGRFKELMKGYAKNPWPMPRVLDRRFCSESLTVASWPKRGAFRAPIWPESFGTPRGYPFVASARPFHPGLVCPGAEGSGDNLYLIEGWSAELVPLDAKAMKALALDAGVGKLPWMEH